MMPAARAGVHECQVSAAYRSEHDGQIAARRLPQRIIIGTTRPVFGSVAVAWIGLAQNPT
jgi:hypothetical protein